jgi:YD repeat-containing protein
MDQGPQIAFSPNSRLPDPRIEILDESFLALRLLSGTVEQLASGFYWAEGPVWFGDGRYLLFSDIPNDRILRWCDASGALAVSRHPSNHANGLARDRQGRLLACEHGMRSVTRTEYDGTGRPAPTRRRSTACASTAPPAPRWRTSTCPSAARTCASAGPSATACSWRRATPCIRCTSTRAARSSRRRRSGGHPSGPAVRRAATIGPALAQCGAAEPRHA